MFETEDMHVFLDILVGALYDGIAEVEVLGLRICCGDFLDLRSRGIVRRRGDVDLLDAVGEAGPEVRFRQARAAVQDERRLDGCVDLLEAVDAEHS